MRETIARLPGSKIREVANAAMGRDDVLAFWFGESDEVTPEAVRDAAARSLHNGETFYSHNLGLAELRQALAEYCTSLHGPVDVERIAVTSSGVNALMLAMQLLAGAGDEVAAVVPLWPNLAAQAEIMGARVRRIALRPVQGRWSLDLHSLRAAVTPATRVLLVNAPNNPTGWTLTRDEQQAILAHCRRTGTWIVADEVYHRFYFAGARSPSFYDLADAEDRILFVNTFSKNWAMTGWRIGWLAAPPSVGQTIENLVQYSTSGVAAFMQRAGVVALDEGEDFIALQVERARRSRDIVCSGLAATGRVRFAEPEGAFYLFFAVDGESDTRRLGLRLVDEANIGVAPGDAFGEAGKGFLRLCFARSPEQIAEATRRLVAWLGK